MITKINESKALANRISCCSKNIFDNKKSNSYQIWNKSKCECECKHQLKHHACEKDYSFNSVPCNCEINKYFENYAYMKNIIDGSLIQCDKITDAVAKWHSNTAETVFFNKL